MSTYNALMNLQGMIKDNKNIREDDREDSSLCSVMSSLSSSTRHSSPNRRDGGVSSSATPPSVYPPAVVETIAAAPQATLPSSDHQDEQPEYTTNNNQYSSATFTEIAAPATIPSPVVSMLPSSSHSAFAAPHDNGVAVTNGGFCGPEGGLPFTNNHRRHSTGVPDHHQLGSGGRRNSHVSHGSARRRSSRSSSSNQHHYPSHNDDVNHHNGQHATNPPIMSCRHRDNSGSNKRTSINDLLTLDMRSYRKLEDAIVTVKLFLENARHDEALEAHRRFSIRGGVGLYVTIITGDSGPNSPGAIFCEILQQIFHNQNIKFIASKDGESLQVDALSGIRTEDSVSPPNSYRHEDNEEESYRPTKPSITPSHEEEKTAGVLSASCTNAKVAVGGEAVVPSFIRDDIPNGNARLMAMAPFLFDNIGSNNNNNQTAGTTTRPPFQQDEEGLFHHPSLPAQMRTSSHCEQHMASPYPPRNINAASSSHNNRMPHPGQQYPQDHGAGMLYNPYDAIAHTLLKRDASGNSSSEASFNMVHNALSDGRLVPPLSNNASYASPLLFANHLSQQQHSSLSQEYSMPVSPEEAALRAAILAQAQSALSLPFNTNGYVPRASSHLADGSGFPAGNSTNSNSLSHHFQPLPQRETTSSSSPIRLNSTSSRRNVATHSSNSGGAPSSTAAPMTMAEASATAVDATAVPQRRGRHHHLSRRRNANDPQDPQIRQAICASQASHIAHTRAQVADDIQFRRALELASNANFEQHQQEQSSSNNINCTNNEEQDLIKMASRRSILDEQHRQAIHEEKERLELAAALDQSTQVHAFEQKEEQRYMKSEEELMAEVMVKSRVEEEEYLQSEEEVMKRVLVNSLEEEDTGVVDEEGLLAEVMRKSLGDGNDVSSEEETEEILDQVLKMSLGEKEKIDLEEEEQLRKAIEWSIMESRCF